MDGKEERHVAEFFFIGVVREGSGECAAPFVAENCLEFGLGLDGVAQTGRSEEGEPEVVVAVGDVFRRAVDVGPAEVFLVIDIGVQRVGLGFPYFVNLALKALRPAENALVVFRIL